ncbi:MAG: LPS export ABC transporter periplasmic protein LptC [Thiotrichaceae bacterium]|nr:LPS export ABC transporter periplasmic protein LptC [Thiotrichaceae bacterium]
MTQRGIYLVLAIFIAIIGTWVHSKWRQYDDFSTSLSQSQIDFYMSGFSAYSTNADGQPQYTLVANHSVKQSKKGTTQIFQPYYTILADSGAITIEAGIATENSTGDIELTHDVIIKSKSNKTEPSYQVNTEQLVYSTRQQKISTDTPIKITGINMIINSIGLTIDLPSQTTKLKSNVHTKYTPLIETPSK